MARSNRTAQQSAAAAKVAEVVTSAFPSGERIYAARYGVNGEPMTWNAMRSHFHVSARSSRFLQECVDYVNRTPELLEKHPEMAVIDAGDRAAIKAAREKGQGFAVLTARTGLKPGELKKIVGEEVGTTARLAYGQRYSGRTPQVEGEADAGEAASEAAAKPATSKRRTRKAASADADLTAKLEASVKAAKPRAARKPRASRKAAA
jgi:hypothetical protein